MTASSASRRRLGQALAGPHAEVVRWRDGRLWVNRVSCRLCHSPVAIATRLPEVLDGWRGHAAGEHPEVLPSIAWGSTGGRDVRRPA